MTREISRRAVVVSGFLGAVGGAAGAFEIPEIVEATSQKAFVLTADWFAGLMQQINANVISDGIEKGFDAAWKGWQPNIVSVAGTTDPFGKGVDAYVGEIFGHPYPPVAFACYSKGKYSDPATDKLAAFVDTGQKSILFEPWAWQALGQFVQQITSGASGSDLAVRQRLAAIALAPADTTPSTGESPEGSVAWMSYQARGGKVEISRLETTVQVTAWGYPGADGGPTEKRFELLKPRDPSAT